MFRTRISHFRFLNFKSGYKTVIHDEWNLQHCRILFKATGMTADNNSNKIKVHQQARKRRQNVNVYSRQKCKMVQPWWEMIDRFIPYNYGAREIGLRLLSKHEGARSIPATHTKPGGVTCVCNSSAEEVQRGTVLRAQLTVSLFWWANSSPSEKLCLKWQDRWFLRNGTWD